MGRAPMVLCGNGGEEKIRMRNRFSPVLFAFLCPLNGSSKRFSNNGAATNVAPVPLHTSNTISKVLLIRIWGDRSGREVQHTVDYLVDDSCSIGYHKSLISYGLLDSRMDLVVSIMVLDIVLNLPPPSLSDEDLVPSSAAILSAEMRVCNPPMGFGARLLLNFVGRTLTSFTTCSRVACFTMSSRASAPASALCASRF